MYPAAAGSRWMKLFQSSSARPADPSAEPTAPRFASTKAEDDDSPETHIFVATFDPDS